MKIAIGSENPTKINAVKKAIQAIYPDAQVLPFPANSGVSEQPRSLEETLQGALNRATHTLNTLTPDLAIGLENGLNFTPQGTFMIGWCVIIDKNNIQGLSQPPALLLPKTIAKALKENPDLTPKNIQEHFQNHQGMVDYLTKQLVHREEGWEIAIRYALATFISPEIYKS